MTPPETRFAVLIFTDIVGSASLKVTHGVEAYSQALRIHNESFERISGELRDIRILQNLGDGYFAEAAGIAEAVKFALRFQEAMREGPWPGVRLTTRVGIHAGEVTTVSSAGGSGIVAPAADLAARLMGLALGGQILLTRFPFDEARHFIREHPGSRGIEQPPLRWLAHGPYLIMGRDEPIDVFEVGAEGLAPLVAPPDSEKAKRAIRAGEEETLGWRPAAGLEIPGRPGWRLIDRLGAGGFGEVWEGEHTKLRQRRAFKFCFDDERLRALKRELTLVRLLREALGDRDDIARIHEIKLDEPPFYLESDLAPHGNLLQWAESQGGLEQVPLPARIALVARTATALAAAHSIGVLHKDIKPSNILIFESPDGEARPRLVDFGISALADSGVLDQYGVTGAGFTRATIQHSTGTPTYSPPEYLAGRPYTIQGDVFGLGVLLYQLVTAKPSDPLAPGWERDVPDALLREDIAACVDGDPARRLPSAADLADRLNRLEERREEKRKRELLEREASARAEAEQAAIDARTRASRLRKLSATFAVLSLLAISGGAWAWNNEKKAGDALIALERKEHERQMANLDGEMFRSEWKAKEALIALERTRHESQLADLRGDPDPVRDLETPEKRGSVSPRPDPSRHLALSILTIADPELEAIRSKWAKLTPENESNAPPLRSLTRKRIVEGEIRPPTPEEKEASEAKSQLMAASAWVRSILSPDLTTVSLGEKIAGDGDPPGIDLLNTPWKRFELALACVNVARSLESPIAVRVRERGGNQPGLLRQRVSEDQGEPKLEAWIQPDNDPLTWRLRAQYLWLQLLLEGGKRTLLHPEENLEIDDADDEAALILFMPGLASKIGITGSRPSAESPVGTLLDDLLAWNGANLENSLDPDEEDPIDQLMERYAFVTKENVDGWILERGEPIDTGDQPTTGDEE